MNLDNPLVFFICSLGVFNGFLVSIYFLFFTKQKRVQNLWFGLLVLFLSLRIGKSVYRIFVSKEELNLLVMQIGLSACFLIGVSLFFYIKTSIEDSKTVSKSSKIHFAVLFLIISSVGLLKPYETNLEFWGVFFKVIYSVWAIYLLASIYILKDVLVKSLSKTKKCTTSEIWLLIVTLGNVLIYIAYLVGYYYLYLIGTVTFSVVFYVLLIFFISKKNRDTIFQAVPQKYNAKKIDKPEVDLLVEKLDILMKEKELYKNTNVKLLSVAKELNITQHKLSQLLNDNIGKSFSSFLNDYRVEESKRLLKEKSKFTLESIGFEAGFSSKSSFYATFKKVVGKTPAQYQKDLL